MTGNRWLVLTVLFVVRTAMGFQFQTVGSLGPLLIDAFGIDYAGLGTLIGLYLLPGALVALPGGLLGERFGARRVAVAGLALMVAGGAVTGFADSFAPAVAGRLIAGAGAVLMNVVVTKMAADWFVGREIRTAMAVLVASWPFGIALGLVAFAPIADALGWHAAMLAAALACLLSAILIAAVYRDPPQAQAAAPAAFSLNLTRREWGLVLLAGLIWGVYNVGYIVLVSFVPAVFTAQGDTLAAANAVASMLGWALIAFVPVGGYLADRTGRPGAVMVAGFVLTAVATALLPSPAFTMAAFAVVLLAGGLPAGAIVALPASVLRPESRSGGMGVFFTCYYACMAVLPALAGWTRDVTGAEGAPLWFGAAMFLVATAALAAFRAIERRPPRPAAFPQDR